MGSDSAFYWWRSPTPLQHAEQPAADAGTLLKGHLSKFPGFSEACIARERLQGVGRARKGLNISIITLIMLCKIIPPSYRYMKLMMCSLVI